MKALASSPTKPARKAKMTRPSAFGLLLLFASLILFSACDDTVIDPFQNEEEYFTVYGYLDMLESEHTLRVVPLTRFAENILAESESQGEIDAEVYTTDLVSGARIKWTHKLSELDDGTLGHTYVARFSVRANRTYRLEVIRSDGKMTTAETHVPVIHTPTLFERGPIVFENDSTLVYRDIKIPQIASPWDIQAIYLWGSGPINRRVYVPYDRTGDRTADGGWQMRINISDDQTTVLDNVAWSVERDQIAATDPFGVSAMGLQIRILDENWDPPNGLFDPEVLAQPGTMSNVENGNGFFGSIGLYIEEWNIGILSSQLGHPY